MKVRVDHERCFGFGRCVEIAPNTFALNDDGQSEAAELHDSEDAIRKAAWACPMQAIEVTTDNAERQPS